MTDIDTTNPATLMMAGAAERDTTTTEQRNNALLCAAADLAHAATKPKSDVDDDHIVGATTILHGASIGEYRFLRILESLDSVGTGSATPPGTQPSPRTVAELRTAVVQMELPSSRKNAVIRALDERIEVNDAGIETEQIRLRDAQSDHDRNVAALQAEIDRLGAENARLTAAAGTPDPAAIEAAKTEGAQSVIAGIDPLQEKIVEIIATSEVEPASRFNRAMAALHLTESDEVIVYKKVDHDQLVAAVDGMAPLLTQQ